MAEPALASNNPFRRHATEPIASSAPTTAAASALASSTPLPPQPELPLSLDTDVAANSGPSSYPVDVEQATQHAHLHPTGNEFRDQLRALPKSSEAPPSTTFIKPKPVKKVRVQSPPPSSPDSVEADLDSRFPASGLGVEPGGIDGRFAADRRFDGDDDDSSSSDSEDPELNTTAVSRGYDDFQPSPISPEAKSATFPIAATHHAPPNPFQKTLGDLEPESQRGDEGQGESHPSTGPGGHIGKGALDVDAFKRLLLTGQTGTGSSPAAATRQQHDGGSITDASSVSRHSLFDAVHPVQETPRSSHEISETDDDRSGLIQATLPGSLERHGTLRKKPPPPSSRHGKLIKTQPGKAGDEGIVSPTFSGSAQRARASSDTNKPLPPPPARRADEEADSIFDREAAGKVPEPDDLDPSDDAVVPARPPTPPNASHSTGAAVDVAAVATTPSPSQTKKVTPTPPPPPPRHGHIRSDSRSSAHDRSHLQTPPSSHSQGDQSRQRDQSPTGSVRSSYESARSRSSSLKVAISAPAPPPPRRANHASRPSTSFISPSSMSFISMPSSASSPSIVSDNDRSPAFQTAPGALAQPSVPSAPPSVDFTAAPLSPSLNRSVSTSSTSGAPPKMGKPIPPPTRNPSIRNKDGRFGGGGSGGRPPSVSSVDAVSRRVTQHGQQPPPPPPRQRGSSRGSMDGPGGGSSGAGGGAGAGGASAASQTQRKTSLDSRRAGSLADVYEGSHGASSGTGDVTGSAANILADLNALQREVDALRGQYPKTGGTS